MSKYEFFNVMTATIDPEYVENVQETVYVKKSFGDLDFWDLRECHPVFGTSRGRNDMKKRGCDFVAVTFNNSANLPATVREPISPVKAVKNAGKSVATVAQNSGWAAPFLVTGLPIAALFALGAMFPVTAPTWALLIAIFSLVLVVFGTGYGVFKFINGEDTFNGRRISPKKIPPKKNLGRFPVDEKFIAMDVFAAGKTIETLEAVNSPLMNSLVFRKLEIEKNRDIFKQWIDAVFTIVSNDSSFPLDAIPLDNEKVVAIAKELVKQVEAEQKAAAIIAEAQRKESLELTQAVEETDVAVMRRFADQDSAKAAQIARDYLAARKQVLGIVDNNFEKM